MKVISYDRLILDYEPDVYISFDNEKVGQLQGEGLVEALKGKPGGQVIEIAATSGHEAPAPAPVARR